MNDIDPTVGRRTATDPRRHLRVTVGFFTGRFGTMDLTEIHDPVERLAVRALHGAAIEVSFEAGCDGHVQVEVILELTGAPPELAKVLIAADKWHETGHTCRRCPQPRQGCVYVHDFLLHQHSAAQLAQISAARRANGAAGSAARWGDPTTRQAPLHDHPKRPPGRPRKNPLPAAAATEQMSLLPTVHPAEVEARRRRGGRPRRTSPRQYDPIVHELCDLLADWQARNDPDGVRPNVTESTWLNVCRLMIEVDGRDPEKIRAAINYSQGDEFCRGWIRSMRKLREAYAALQNRAMRDRARQSGVTGRPRNVPDAVTVPNMTSLYEDDMPGASR